jgi:hypothetical protein
MADTLPTFDVATINNTSLPSKAEIASRLFSMGLLATDNLSLTADPLLSPQERQAAEFAHKAMVARAVEFSKRVHSNPFFPTPTDTVQRVFDTHYRHNRTTVSSYSLFVQLPAYLIRATKVEVSYSGLWGASVTPVELTEGAHFEFHDKGGEADYFNPDLVFNPKTHIAFNNEWWRSQNFSVGDFALSGVGKRGSIRITGKWGYSETIPEDIRECLAQFAVMEAAQSLASLNAGCLSPGDKQTIEAGPIKTTLTGGMIAGGAAVNKRYGDEKQRQSLGKRFNCLIQDYRREAWSG